MGVRRIRQATVNMAAVTLWHLLEQQLLMFHIREVLDANERISTNFRNIEKLKSRLKDNGCDIEQLSSWAKLRELKLVANALKHGPGPSLTKLFKIRPDLLVPPGMKRSSHFNPLPSYVESPAGGYDIFVKDDDLQAYFDTVISFLNEFSDMIEKHSEDMRNSKR